MTSMHVLIVEDDRKLARLLERGLAEAGMRTDVAARRRARRSPG